MGRSIQGALSYNERKVTKGDADLLLAHGFPCDAHTLGFTAKLSRFSSLNELRPKVKTNTLHLSLNFPPEEKLSETQMITIAKDYMERIGFGGQPFLVYRHKDTRHPHLHIVTNTIRENGEAIPLHNLGKDKSEPARKAIEEDYALISAESRKARSYLPTSAFNLLPVNYGDEEVKHTITNILTNVLALYKFTSLEDFNVILRQSNVVADRGSVNSRLYQTGGLVYSILDPDGERIGRSIKASDIHGFPSSPTLKFLKRKFTANAVKKAAVKEKTKELVQRALTTSTTAPQFAHRLGNMGLQLHFDQDRLGVIKKIYFVDHLRKATYDHLELGIQLNAVYALRAANVQTGLPHEPRPAATVRRTSPEPAILQFGTHSTHLLMHSLFGQQGIRGPAGDPPNKKKKKRRPPL